jgi:uncharacterized protein YndB with AHSA1/START domain
VNRHDSLTAGSSSAAPVERVWELLTTRRAEWWPEMLFDPFIGAPLRETWDVDGAEYSAEGTVTEVIPGDLLAFEWSEPGWPNPLLVRIELRSREGRTWVTLTESGFGSFDDDDRLSAEHLQGWSFHLARLCHQAESSESTG